MKVTIRQLVNSNSTLQKLCLIPAGDSLTLVQAYKIGKIATAGETEIKQLDALRMNLFEAYGETIDVKVDETTTRQERRIKEEHIADFTRQVEEMLDLEVDIPGDAIPVSDLPDSIGLTAVDLVNLAWLITGD